MRIRQIILCVVLAGAVACHKSPTSPTETPEDTNTTTTTTTETQPAPIVAEISPTIGNVEGGTTVTITGTDFSNVSAVLFGELTAASFVVESDTSITAMAPAGTVGPVDVRVVTLGGTSEVNDAGVFTWDTNVITGLSFAAASVRAGTPIRGTVTLRYPAPSGGTRLSLVWDVTSSGTAVVLYPVTLVVPGGATTATFQVTTFSASAAHTLAVAAGYGGVTLNAAFSLEP